MEAVNGVSDGGPPPPSPLTGCYLLIVVGEPHSQEHKDIILQRVAKGLLSWDINDCLIDLEKELAIITEQAPEGEEARYGERLIQYASENLVTEVLIHPAVSTLAQCVRNLLSSFTRHRHIIHAGYTFAANGSWILQDGTFSLVDFSEAFQEIEVQRVIRAYENSISVDLHCSPEGDWSRLPKESFAKNCKVRMNPVDVLNSGSPSITNFLNYISPFVIPTDIESLLESSDVVGNIRFSHPTLYIFPGGQGDAALFGINGFNMLLDGGFSRKACFWDFVRHLDRLDAVLLTRLNNGNASGISAVLRRKMQNALYPQIGHFFCNIPERKAILSPDGDKDKDPLLVDLLEEGQEIITNLKKLSLTPQTCYRDTEPINLYHKVGHGTLDMYVLSPAKESKEVKDFLLKWNTNDQKLFSNQRSGSATSAFPVPNLVSICALLIWQPANPSDNITRILYPGSTPQHKIFEGLDKLKNLEYIKYPMCSEKSLLGSSSIITLKAKQQHLKDNALEKLIQSEVKAQKIIPTTENKLLKEKTAKSAKLENKLIETSGGDKIDSINGVVDTTDSTDKSVKKSDSTDSEKSARSTKPSKKTDVENGKPKTEPKPKEEKTKAAPPPAKPRPAEKRRPLTADKKASPTTPKKTIEAKINGDARDVKPQRLSKVSPSATPAKSAKDANNRKVVESKQQRTAAPKREPVAKKPERKPISRRPKGAAAAAPAKPAGSPVKKIVNGAAAQKPDSILKKGKLDKEGTTDSSTVSTPSADHKDLSKLTQEELDQLKAQELADLKEEQEVVKEIEAVFRKGEAQTDNESELRKIKDISLEDKTEPEEYLIIEKEEIEHDSLDEKDTKEDEMQKLTRDSEESEKLRKLSDDAQKPTEKIIEEDKVSELSPDETQKEVKEKPAAELSKELSSVTSPEEKLDGSSEKKIGEGDVQEQAGPLESQPDEKFSATVESGATTAPTLPEDERITLDEIKEDNGDQVIEEKHVKEDTKEKDVPVIQVPSKTLESITKLPAVVGIRLDKQAHIRDIVKTPDEVADLPVHEEVDIEEDYRYQMDQMKKIDDKADAKPEKADEEKVVPPSEQTKTDITKTETDKKEEKETTEKKTEDLKAEATETKKEISKIDESKADEQKTIDKVEEEPSAVKAPEIKQEEKPAREIETEAKEDKVEKPEVKPEKEETKETGREIIKTEQEKAAGEDKEEPTIEIQDTVIKPDEEEIKETPKTDLLPKEAEPDQKQKVEETLKPALDADKKAIKEEIKVEKDIKEEVTKDEPELKPKESPKVDAEPKTDEALEIKKIETEEEVTAKPSEKKIEEAKKVEDEKLQKVEALPETTPAVVEETTKQKVADSKEEADEAILKTEEIKEAKPEVSVEKQRQAQGEVQIEAKEVTVETKEIKEVEAKELKEEDDGDSKLPVLEEKSAEEQKPEVAKIQPKDVVSDEAPKADETVPIIKEEKEKEKPQEKEILPEEPKKESLGEIATVKDEEVKKAEEEVKEEKPSIEAKVTEEDKPSAEGKVTEEDKKMEEKPGVEAKITEEDEKLQEKSSTKNKVTEEDKKIEEKPSTEAKVIEEDEKLELKSSTEAKITEEDRKLEETGVAEKIKEEDKKIDLKQILMEESVIPDEDKEIKKIEEQKKDVEEKEKPKDEKPTVDKEIEKVEEEKVKPTDDKDQEPSIDQEIKKVEEEKMKPTAGEDQAKDKEIKKVEEKEDAEEKVKPADDKDEKLTTDKEIKTIEEDEKEDVEKKAKLAEGEDQKPMTDKEIEKAEEEQEKVKPVEGKDQKPEVKKSEEEKVRPTEEDKDQETTTDKEIKKVDEEEAKPTDDQVQKPAVDKEIEKAEEEKVKRVEDKDEKPTIEEEIKKVEEEKAAKPTDDDKDQKPAIDEEIKKIEDEESVGEKKKEKSPDDKDETPTTVDQEIKKAEEEKAKLPDDDKDHKPTIDKEIEKVEEDKDVDKKGKPTDDDKKEVKKTEEKPTEDEDRKPAVDKEIKKVEEDKAVEEKVKKPTDDKEEKPTVGEEIKKVEEEKAKPTVDEELKKVEGEEKAKPLVDEGQKPVVEKKIEDKDVEDKVKPADDKDQEPHKEIKKAEEEEKAKPAEDKDQKSSAIDKEIEKVKEVEEKIKPTEEKDEKPTGDEEIKKVVEEKAAKPTDDKDQKPAIDAEIKKIDEEKSVGEKAKEKTADDKDETPTTLDKEIKKVEEDKVKLTVDDKEQKPTTDKDLEKVKDEKDVEEKVKPAEDKDDEKPMTDKEIRKAEEEKEKVEPAEDKDKYQKPAGDKEIEERKVKPTDDKDEKPTIDKEIKKAAEEEKVKPTDDKDEKPTIDKEIKKAEEESAKPTDDKDEKPTFDKAIEKAEEEKVKPIDDKDQKPATDKEVEQEEEEEKVKPAAVDEKIVTKEEVVEVKEEVKKPEGKELNTEEVDLKQKEKEFKKMEEQVDADAEKEDALKEEIDLKQYLEETTVIAEGEAKRTDDHKEIETGHKLEAKKPEGQIDTKVEDIKPESQKEAETISDKPKKEETIVKEIPEEKETKKAEDQKDEASEKLREDQEETAPTKIAASEVKEKAEVQKDKPAEITGEKPAAAEAKIPGKPEVPKDEEILTTAEDKPKKEEEDDLKHKDDATKTEAAKLEKPKEEKDDKPSIKDEEVGIDGDSAEHKTEGDQKIEIAKADVSLEKQETKPGDLEPSIKTDVEEKEKIQKEEEEVTDIPSDKPAAVQDAAIKREEEKLEKDETKADEVKTELDEETKGTPPKAIAEHSTEAPAEQRKEEQEPPVKPDVKKKPDDKEQLQPKEEEEATEPEESVVAKDDKDVKTKTIDQEDSTEKTLDASEKGIPKEKEVKQEEKLSDAKDVAKEEEEGAKEAAEQSKTLEVEAEKLIKELHEDKEISKAEESGKPLEEPTEKSMKEVVDEKKIPSAEETTATLPLEEAKKQAEEIDDNKIKEEQDQLKDSGKEEAPPDVKEKEKVEEKVEKDVAETEKPDSKLETATTKATNSTAAPKPKEKKETDEDKLEDNKFQVEHDGTPEKPKEDEVSQVLKPIADGVKEEVEHHKTPEKPKEDEVSKALKPIADDVKEEVDEEKDGRSEKDLKGELDKVKEKELEDLIGKKLVDELNKEDDIVDLDLKQKEAHREPDIIDKMELGRKSPKEREEDVAIIVASVAEVLKSDAPLEEFEGKIPLTVSPFASFTATYTTELRETHITTVDSPIAEEPSKRMDAQEILEGEDGGGAKMGPSKISELIRDSTELMEATSKIISGIKASQPPEEAAGAEEEAAKAESDSGTVHRMLVTASSEDGGEEIEICPKGTITFSKSSESSGRSSPEPRKSIHDDHQEILPTPVEQTTKEKLPEPEKLSGKSTPIDSGRSSPETRISGTKSPDELSEKDALLPADQTAETTTPPKSEDLPPQTQEVEGKEESRGEEKKPEDVKVGLPQTDPKEPTAKEPTEKEASGTPDASRKSPEPKLGEKIKEEEAPADLKVDGDLSQPDSTPTTKEPTEKGASSIPEARESPEPKPGEKTKEEAALTTSSEAPAPGQKLDKKDLPQSKEASTPDLRKSPEPKLDFDKEDAVTKGKASDAQPKQEVKDAPQVPAEDFPKPPEKTDDKVDVKPETIDKDALKETTPPKTAEELEVKIAHQTAEHKKDADFTKDDEKPKDEGLDDKGSDAAKTAARKEDEPALPIDEAVTKGTSKDSETAVTEISKPEDKQPVQVDTSSAGEDLAKPSVTTPAGHESIIKEKTHEVEEEEVSKMVDQQDKPTEGEKEQEILQDKEAAPVSNKPKEGGEQKTKDDAKTTDLTIKKVAEDKESIKEKTHEEQEEVRKTVDQDKSTTKGVEGKVQDKEVALVSDKSKDGGEHKTKDDDIKTTIKKADDPETLPPTYTSAVLEKKEDKETDSKVSDENEIPPSYASCEISSSIVGKSAADLDSSEKIVDDLEDFEIIEKEELLTESGEECKEEPSRVSELLTNGIVDDDVEDQDGDDIRRKEELPEKRESVHIDEGKASVKEKIEDPAKLKAESLPGAVEKEEKSPVGVSEKALDGQLALSSDPKAPGKDLTAVAKDSKLAEFKPESLPGAIEKEEKSSVGASEKALGDGQLAVSSDSKAPEKDLPEAKEATTESFDSKLPTTEEKSLPQTADDIKKKEQAKKEPAAGLIPQTDSSIKENVKSLVQGPISDSKPEAKITTEQRSSEEPKKDREDNIVTKPGGGQKEPSGEGEVVVEAIKDEVTLGGSDKDASVIAGESIVPETHLTDSDKSSESEIVSLKAVPDLLLLPRDQQRKEIESSTKTEATKPEKTAATSGEKILDSVKLAEQKTEEKLGGSSGGGVAGPSSKAEEDAADLSGKSTPDIADVERHKEMQETLKFEKHIPGCSTPPTVPVSPIVKDVHDVCELKTAVATVKDQQDLRSSTPGSDDYEVTTRSDVSSGQMSRAPNLLLEGGEQHESDEDEDILGSPMSVTSQIGHSPSSHYEFDDDKKMPNQMSASFYGTLPGEAESGGRRFLDESDLDFEKAMQEHRQARGEDLTDSTSPSHLYELTTAKYAAGKLKTPELPPPASSTKPDLMTSSFIGTELPRPGDDDPISSWGKPLGLPSPAPPNDNKGTPKKERKLPPNVTAKNKLNDDKKRAESPSKYDKKHRKVSPVYVDLTYVPHHGNSNYSYVDFFKRVRARYYVFSGIEPSKEVYNALLEAKQTWEDKDLEVTIIPTYDTDVLGYWVAENEDLLTKCKIDLSPSASRCTINLQDHETSCSAYRLEF